MPHIRDLSEKKLGEIFRNRMENIEKDGMVVFTKEDLEKHLPKQRVGIMSTRELSIEASSLYTSSSARAFRNKLVDWLENEFDYVIIDLGDVDRSKKYFSFGGESWIRGAFTNIEKKYHNRISFVGDSERVIDAEQRLMAFSPTLAKKHWGDEKNSAKPVAIMLGILVAICIIVGTIVKVRG